MAITQLPPNTIWLGGPRTEIGDLSAKEAITPGHLVEMVNTAGVWQWQKHATAGGNTTRAVATEQSMLNKSVDDAYAAGDLVEVSEGAGGSYFWMWIASGQDIAFGQGLESAGDGTLRAIASGTMLYKARETKNVVVATRIRVEVV